MQDKQIVFISNSFGFGPTAKLFPIMELFNEDFDYPLYFLTGDTNSQIIKQNYLNISQIDERSVEEIKLRLSQFNNPYVISSLNRFALKACKELNLPCVFIDGLTWLWKSIPEEYLTVDKYYSLSFIGVDEKVSGIKKAKKVQYILDVKKLMRDVERKDFVLFQIGGFKNPLYNSAENFYLQILSASLNKIEEKIKIILTGGNDALKFLRKLNRNTNITFETAPKDRFHDLLLSCKHLVTTSGLTTSLEAFYTNTPTSFLLPSNLSQFRILELFKVNNVSDSSVDWRDFFDVKMQDMDEREGLEYLDKLAEQLLNDRGKMERFLSKMKSLVEEVPNPKVAKIFIDEIGVNGAVEIVDDLTKLWNL